MPCHIFRNDLSVLDYAEKDTCHKQSEQDIESLCGKERLERLVVLLGKDLFEIGLQTYADKCY